jgi:hypothetical protein
MISAFVGHLVGDFLLQNTWMADKKKKDSMICVLHCWIWASCVVFFADWPLRTFFPLFALHFLQDRTTIVEWWMDIIGSRSFRTGTFAPWSVVIVDNVWHILTLWITWKLLGSP